MSPSNTFATRRRTSLKLVSWYREFVTRADGLQTRHTSLRLQKSFYLVEDSFLMPHIVILAAGSSSRLGSPKQLIDWQGKPLLRHLAEQALATNVPVTIILGANKDLIHPTIADLPLTILDNDGWQEGMSSSIRLAATTIDGSALLLMVCDQPHVTTEHLGVLIEARSKSNIIASAYADTLGVPALFDQSLFGELAALTGQQGAKAVIQHHRSETLGIDFPAGIFDLDTSEDVARSKTSS